MTFNEIHQMILHKNWAKLSQTLSRANPRLIHYCKASYHGDLPLVMAIKFGAPTNVILLILMVNPTASLIPCSEGRLPDELCSAFDASKQVFNACCAAKSANKNKTNGHIQIHNKNDNHSLSSSNTCDRSMQKKFDSMLHELHRSKRNEETLRNKLDYLEKKFTTLEMQSTRLFNELTEKMEETTFYNSHDIKEMRQDITQIAAQVDDSHIKTQKYLKKFKDIEKKSRKAVRRKSGDVSIKTYRSSDSLHSIRSHKSRNTALSMPAVIDYAIENFTQ